MEHDTVIILRYPPPLLYLSKHSTLPIATYGSIAVIIYQGPHCRWEPPPDGQTRHTRIHHTTTQSLALPDMCYDPQTPNMRSTVLRLLRLPVHYGECIYFESQAILIPVLVRTLGDDLRRLASVLQVDHALVLEHARGGTPQMPCCRMLVDTEPQSTMRRRILPGPLPGNRWMQGPPSRCHGHRPSHRSSGPSVPCQGLDRRASATIDHRTDIPTGVNCAATATHIPSHAPCPHHH